ncbi:MAG: tetratricopeptide repeat protein [Candidatus Cloacimonadales bacterium]
MQSISELVAALNKQNCSLEEKYQLNQELGEKYLAEKSQQAIDAYRACAVLAEELQDSTKILAATQALGNAYYKLSEFKKSVKTYQSALANPLIENNLEDKAECLNSIGANLWMLGDYDAALDNFQQSYKIWEKTPNLSKQASSLNNIGLVYANLTRYDKALHYLMQAIELEEKLDNKKGMLSAYNNIGIIYYNLQYTKQAIEFQKKAYALCREMGDEAGLYSALNNLGMISSNEGRNEEALDYYLQAEEICRKIGQQYGLVTISNNIAGIYQDQKEYDLAKQYSQQALRLSEKIENKHGTAETLLRLGSFYMATDDLPQAIIYLKRSLKLAKELQSQDLIKRAYHFLAEYNAELGKYAEAYKYSSLYAEILGNIHTEEGKQKMAEMQAKYDISQKEKEAEIYRLRNVELDKANKKIHEQREHLHFITKLLRHDLKNNLVAIQSALRIFERQGRTEVLSEAYCKAQNSIELISKMKELEDLLQEKIELKPYVIGAVLQKVIGNYPEKAIRFTRSQAVVWANETIYSVFDNIIGNAIMHGEVQQVQIAVQEQADEVLVEIADEGRGIPDEIKQKIFQESFIYGDSGNTGLGLFIVQKAIEGFGGSIEVLDNQPRGTIFRIHFPQK